MLVKLTPGGSGGSWTQTLDLEMIRQMFYHCATTADQKNSKNLDTTIMTITSLFKMTILITLKQVILLLTVFIYFY